MSVMWKPSPNYTDGRQGHAPVGIVVHIMQGSMSDTDSWFTTTKSRVSAHYGIAASGEVHQYVAEGDSAWHAGRVYEPTWPLLKPGVNPNLYTIGIEHEGQSGSAWPDAQFQTSAALIAEIATRWAIPLDRDHIVQHADIYGLKPFCPGGGVNLDELIARARALATTNAANNFVPSARSVTTTTDLNLRTAPNTHANITRTIAATTALDTVGWTSNGETVHGNSHWYRTADGNYAWAGGTNQPIPTAP